MKYILFAGIVAVVLLWQGQRRRQAAEQERRLEQLRAQRQAEFRRETDALNPHLRRGARRD